MDLSGLSSKLSESWFATLLTPAFAFWLGALVAALSCGDHSLWSLAGNPFNQQLGPCTSWSLAGLLTWFSYQEPSTQLLLALGGFLLVAVSGAAAQYFVLPLIRVVEGYWPSWLNGLRTSIIDRKLQRSRQDSRRWEELQQHRAAFGSLTRAEQNEFRVLEGRLARVPNYYEMRDRWPVLVPDERAFLPPRLGDILSNTENRPKRKYGLNSIIVWPSLWLVLPESTRAEITEARSHLNSAVVLLFWSLLFLVWVIFAWWVLPASALVGFVAYQGVIAAAITYGILVEAAFDTHRFLLYEALRLPLPSNAKDERKQGEALSDYLWRGSLGRGPTFIHPNASPDGATERNPEPGTPAESHSRHASSGS